MSPASIAIALSMTYGGARGTTASEMAKAMHLPDAATLHGAWATVLARWTHELDGVELRVANRLFGDESYRFEPTFVTLTADRYAAPLEAVDFRGSPEVQRSYINGWVEQRTAKRIVGLIPRGGIDADTRLVLANALYFKAPWMDAFNADLTEPGTFHADGARAVKVPFMSRVAHLGFADTGDAQLVQLDYRGNQTSMLLVVPTERTGLGAIEQKLSGKLLRSWVDQLEGRRVWLRLPRFEVETAEPLRLKEPLRSLGMRRAFLRGQADFTGIANPADPEDRVSIGEVFHKAFVAVDEKGTEAAAATAVVMVRAGALALEPTRVTVDRPFLFFIRDRGTRALLFVGRVVDPS